MTAPYFFYWQRDMSGKIHPARSLIDPRTRLAPHLRNAQRIRVVPTIFAELDLRILALIYPPPGIDYSTASPIAS